MRAAPKNFVAVSPGARKKFWPRAHGGNRDAHQRVQDQRGRGDPVAALGDYTDGIERINIEAVAGQQAAARRRALAAFFFWPAYAQAWGPSDARPAQDALDAKAEEALA
jgi:hypothetical protein